MPPLSLSTGQSRISSAQFSNSLIQLPEILFLALVTASCVRLGVAYFARRKSRMTESRVLPQEKGSIATVSLSEKDPKSGPPKDQEVCSNTPPKPDPAKLEELPPRLEPIYPWTCPPQPLPGPYDPRLYPLPTLRRHSSVDADSDDNDNPQEICTIDYTRRVSTNSIPPGPSTLHGTITTTSSGNWRRNHWVVTGG